MCWPEATPKRFLNRINLSFANKSKTAFSSHRGLSHFLSSPCSGIPGGVPTSCCSSLKGGLQGREPAAILAAKACSRVDRLLEEAPGVSPQWPGAHRGYSLGQAAPQRARAPPQSPNPPAAVWQGHRLRARCVLLPSSWLVGPALGKGL